MMSNASFSPLRQEFQVQFRYAVHFTERLFDPDNPLLAQVAAGQEQQLPKKLLAVVDQGLLEHHPGLLEQIDDYCRRHQAELRLAHPTLVVPGGEQVKNNSAALESLLQAINDGGICRHSYLLAVGGGAVLDMAGYAAATAHRGVRLMRVPTTVLAQNDSAVGVKTSINAFGKKNFLGSFTPPYAVLNDASFLPTLGERDWRSGMAEAIKVALIKDAGFFAQIEQERALLVARDMQAMQRQIYHCARLHMAHIAGGDPFELGSSRPLDFGHWSAHKIEQLSGYRLRHGEAVAIGIALDSTYSYLEGLLDQPSWGRIISLIAGLGFDLVVPELDDPQALLSGLNEFREHLGGELTIMLLRGIGVGHEVHSIDHQRVVESIALLKRLSHQPVSGRQHATRKRVPDRSTDVNVQPPQPQPFARVPAQMDDGG